MSASPRRSIALFLALIVGLFAIPSGLAAAGNHGNDQGAQVCPDSGGWTKIESNSGSVGGVWGSLEWDGLTAEWTVEEGWTLEICVKAGQDLTKDSGTGPDSGTVTMEHDISHTSYRVTEEETPDPNPGRISFTKVAGENAPGDVGDLAFEVSVTCTGPSDSDTVTLGVGDTEETKDLVAGSECSYTETTSHGATATFDPAGPVTVLEDETVAVTVTNDWPEGGNGGGNGGGDGGGDGGGGGSGPDFGDLVVAKVVTGDGEPDEAAEFSFTVSCDDDFTLGSTGGSQTFTDLPEDTECTVTESGDGGADATFVVVDPDGDELGAEASSATVTIPADETVTVRFTNRFDPDETAVLGNGFVEVEKLVTGDGAPDVEAVFAFELACEGFDPGQAGAFSIDSEGGSHEVGIGIPAGAFCAVLEADRGGADVTTVAVDPVGDDSGIRAVRGEFTVAEDETTLVRFTNRFDADDTAVLGPGFLRVAKTVSGDGSPDDSAAFAFSVDCAGFDLGGAGSFQLGRTGGVHDVGISIPEDTECTVTEAADGDADATTVMVRRLTYLMEDGERTLVHEAVVSDAAAGSSATVTIPAAASGAEETVMEVAFDNRFDAAGEETRVEAEEITRPTRVDAGAGGAAGGLPWPGLLLMLGGAAVAVVSLRRSLAGGTGR